MNILVFAMLGILQATPRDITVKPHVQAGEVQAKIEAA